MGVSLVITSANVTEIPYMEVLKIVVSAMFGFRRFIRQYWSCMLPCVLDELLLSLYAHETRRSDGEHYPLSTILLLFRHMRSVDPKCS